MSTLSELEKELAEQQDDLASVKEMLELDPDSTDALEMKPMLEAAIADLQAQIAAAKAAPPPPPEDDAPPPPPKYDMSKHPKFRKQEQDAPPPPPPAEEREVVFNVKDTVMAKYSADKQWYPATILTKTGSPADPVYKVLFKGYDDQETKRKHEIRAIENKKRKADGTPASSTPQPPAPVHKPQNTHTTQNGGATGTVISAAPSVDKSVLPQQQKKEPSKVSDGPTRLAPEPKKLKGNKVLEKGKSNWQDFQKSGPKKTGAFGQASKGIGGMGKESMFRTPDLPGAKVGFTGSGKGMKKDQARTTWKFKDDAVEDQ